MFWRVVVERKDVAIRGMRWFALSVLLGCAACAANTPTVSTTTGSWIQVWSDEFAGPAGARIDTTKWRFDLGDGCANGNCGWGNKEKEYYRDASENIALNGQGQLQIVARIAPPPGGLTCYYGPCRYTSAKITTQHKEYFAPGRVEARIKLSRGQGLWPAFWLLGKSFPPWPDCGELDVMENKGSAPTRTSSSVHGPGYFGNTPITHVQTFARGSSADAFHTYAVEWDSLHIRFFVDDTVHYAVTRSEVEAHGRWVFDQPFFVILNLAVGGHFDGDPQSDAIFPATMLVDYVRVYRRAQ